jgi:AraC family transcriptional regulator, regulatory protein of adaptative response / DNA-3-methyladenine glycosylase II
LSGDPLLAPLILARPGLRVPGGWDGFETAVRAVLGQQITLKAATRLAGGVVGSLGTRVTEPLGLPGLTQVFPRPGRFQSAGLAHLGMTKARAASLAGIAKAAVIDPRLFEPQSDLAEAVARLRDIAGVGEWTAQYIAMRALGESDAFLAGDVALHRTLANRGNRPSIRELIARAERWRPWRAYAMLYLWIADADSAPVSPTKEAYNAISA